VLPIFEQVDLEALDAHAAARLAEMRSRYAAYIERSRA
jgi:hypothetical protein